MQTFLQYGGKNLTDAYVSKFIAQYEHSRQRFNDLQFDTRDQYRANKDDRDELEENEKKRREEIQKLFGIGSPVGGIESSLLKQTKPEMWDKVFKRKNIRKGDAYHDDDGGDDDDDDNNGGKQRLQRVIRKEFDRYELRKGPSKPAGLADDDGGGDDDDDDPEGRDDYGGGGGGDDAVLSTSTNDLLHRDPISVDSPREIFRSNAYAERAEFVSPISGQISTGYDNIGASSLNTMLDTTRNVMIRVSVDQHRTGTSPSLKKNNRRLKKRLFKFADKRDARRSGMVNQFGEMLDTNPSEAEEDTMGTISRFSSSQQSRHGRCRSRLGCSCSGLSNKRRHATASSTRIGWRSTTTTARRSKRRKRRGKR